MTHLYLPRHSKCVSTPKCILCDACITPPAPKLFSLFLVVLGHTAFSAAMPCPSLFQKLQHECLLAGTRGGEARVGTHGAEGEHRTACLRSSDRPAKGDGPLAAAVCHATPTLSGSRSRTKFTLVHPSAPLSADCGARKKRMASQLSRVGRRGLPLLQQLERAAPGAVQQFSSAADAPAAGGQGRGAGRGSGSGGRGPHRSGGRVRAGNAG